MNEEEYDLPAAEQFAFNKAHDLLDELERQGLFPADIGRGFLTASVHALSKAMTRKEIAEIMYQYADDNAVREN